MPKKTEVLVFPEYWKLYGLAEDGAELSARRAWNFGVLQTQRLYLPIVQENEKLLKELKDAFSALDDALGGNDADVESDEEERENYPVQYAARIISGIIQNMQKEKRRRTPRVPDACPYCAGKGEFVNVIGKALRCNHCAGTGQRR